MAWGFWLLAWLLGASMGCRQKAPGTRLDIWDPRFKGELRLGVAASSWPILWRTTRNQLEVAPDSVLAQKALLMWQGRPEGRHCRRVRASFVGKAKLFAKKTKNQREPLRR